MDKLKKRIQNHKQEIKRLEAIVNDKDTRDYIKKSCALRAKQLKTAVKLLTGKLAKLS